MYGKTGHALAGVGAGFTVLRFGLLAFIIVAAGSTAWRLIPIARRRRLEVAGQ